MMHIESTAKKILQFEKECFKNDFWKLPSIISHLKNPFSITLLQDNGYILGVYSEYDYELLRIGVLPSFREKGIGSRLIFDFISLYNEKDIFLEVNEKNSPAISLYEKYNFKKVAIRKNYYGSDNALIYKLTRQ